ncbi:hypothetical protein FA15DRAFT_606812 [Coprinopsis marcescibilis]|uniref:Uncharacterized protein n=1 Tax=Coprinopsis marcescibilis TaxID=230819 RepID=A0A5C3KAG9_COPMA|nr:hypothetical protein FA15DRAFT_606812 [Coprinopsis marcescibilis]
MIAYVLILGFTVSADGTSHRAVNYNSRHVNVKVQSTSEAGEEVEMQATRFLGIVPSIDGSSKESIRDWEALLTNITDLFNRSPFGKRHCLGLLRVVDVLVKLTGMHSDHCAKEKKDAEALKSMKLDARQQVLGEERFLEMKQAELLEVFIKAREALIKKVGGKGRWDLLTPGQQAERNATMVHGIILDLGKESLELMSDGERRIMELFIWAGCGCHKDLNTVKAFYKGVQDYYADNPDIPKPILLANRDNAVVIDDIQDDEEETPAQARALDRTTGGGLKAAQLAGALLNHKDDKKGHHDKFRWWWQKNVGSTFTFPDTSNTRFGSYCEAAGALVLHHTHFVDFMAFLKSQKDKPGFNHMEQNFWNALHCDATLAELAALALYGQCISHPYMHEIRDSAAQKKNMLDLGPLHTKYQSFIDSAIAEPSILLGSTNYKTATANGLPWHSEAVVKQAHSLIPSFPKFEEMFVAGLKGASETWMRFTSEFAPGGLIDEATQQERDLAWLSPTNDINEGALGSFRLMMRKQPQLSLLGHNSQAMYFQNDTSDFIKRFFVEPEDYKFLHQMARETMGKDRRRQKEIVEHQEKKANERKENAAKRLAKKQENEKRIQDTELAPLLNPEHVKKLKKPQLQDALKVFFRHNAVEIRQLVVD